MALNNISGFHHGAVDVFPLLGQAVQFFFLDSLKMGPIFRRHEMSVTSYNSTPVRGTYLR